MLDVCIDPRTDLAVEGSFSSECVHPTRMATRPHPAAAALAARLADGVWLAASPTRAWISSAAPDTTQQITAPAIRSLLDGAWAAARGRSAPRDPAPLTSSLQIWQLVGHFHLSHSITLLLEFAAERFATDGQPVLAQWARARARAQAQHDARVLDDMKAKDVDPTRAIAALRPHPAERLAARLRMNVLADPINCVGYAYAIEQLAVELGIVERDDSNCEETVTLLTRLSATRCEAVARAVFDLACSCGSAALDGYPEEATVARRLGGSFATPL
jgi:hypothetical protein